MTLNSHCIPEIREALFWPTFESLTGWGEYLAISIPVTAMICASWWAFEIFVLASGFIGIKEQAA